MEFAAPLYAWLAVPVALILFLTLRGERVRQAALLRLAEPHLLRRLVPLEKKSARMLRLLLPSVVMILLVLALMRPQWGLVEEEQTSTGLDIIFAVDLSRSMLADDLLPSRLAVAKEAVLKALESAGGDRAGIIAFAGTAFLVCPLTSDHEMVRTVLNDLGTRTLPRGGTSVASSLREAARAFRGSPGGGRVLVVLSDGEDHSGETGEAVKALCKEGIKVVSCLVGTSSGGLMPLGDGSFVKDRGGAAVKSKADLRTLQLIDPSAATVSGTADGVAARIAAVRKQLSETSRKERRKRLAERYYIPLGAALAIWCCGLLLTRGRMAA